MLDVVELVDGVAPVVDVPALDAVLDVRDCSLMYEPPMVMSPLEVPLHLVVARWVSSTLVLECG